MNTAKRFSKQRFTVFTELSKLNTHPTADEIYEITKKTIPNISLGTVYRNLSNLEKDGKILKFTIDGREHFDANIKPHIHLCCRKCANISDVFYDFGSFANEILNNKAFKIDNIIINGYCEKCLENTEFKLGENVL